MRPCGCACACMLKREWVLSEDERGQCETGEGGEVREGSGGWGGYENVQEHIV